ncbi:MAG TPA: flavin reductase family protein [Burkholderiaceae bacterium]|nr:flavin reductase family protein [Burkholderiaceae bacterium]
MTHKVFDPSTMSTIEQSKLIAGSVIPRPIAFVTTTGSSGVNAAPFSYFNIASVEPPVLMFSIGVTAVQRAGTDKDTLQNLREVPECVIHIVSHEIREAMNFCAAEHTRGVDELTASGLTAVASRTVRPPRIAECPVAYECGVLQIIPIGKLPYHLVLAEVRLMHFREDIVNERLHVDAQAMDPIGRLAAAGSYARITDSFVMPLPREAL